MTRKSFLEKITTITVTTTRKAKKKIAMWLNQHEFPPVFTRCRVYMQHSLAKEGGIHTLHARTQACIHTHTFVSAGNLPFVRWYFDPASPGPPPAPPGFCVDDLPKAGKVTRKGREGELFRPGLTASTYLRDYGEVSTK